MMGVDAAVVDVRRIARPAPAHARRARARGRHRVAGVELARTGIAVELSLSPLGEIGPQASTAAFRILQECLTNVARHAAATAVCVAVSERNGLLDLSVADDGRGMARAAQSRKKTFAAWDGSRAPALADCSGRERRPGRRSRCACRHGRARACPEQAHDQRPRRRRSHDVSRGSEAAARRVRRGRDPRGSLQRRGAAQPDGATTIATSCCSTCDAGAQQGLSDPRARRQPAYACVQHVLHEEQQYIVEALKSGATAT